MATSSKISGVNIFLKFLARVEKKYFWRDLKKKLFWRDLEKINFGQI